VMDVPSTINVVTSKVLEAQAAEGLYDAVRNTAGVTRQQNGGDTWDQLVIRGMEVQNRTNYRLNGSMPIMNFAQVPMENKARVEVLKGASALYYGFTAPSGIVNYVTKLLDLTQSNRVVIRLNPPRRPTLLTIVTDDTRYRLNKQGELMVQNDA